MSDDLSERLARLEAVEEIKTLKHRYCAYCDDGYNPEGIAGLFTEDGVWDGEDRFGRYVGRQAIQTFFRNNDAKILFAAHLVMNPIIEIDSLDHASGKWRLIMPATAVVEEKKEARWLLCAYADQYVRVQGKWLFKTVQCHFNFYVPHHGSWAETAVA